MTGNEKLRKVFLHSSCPASICFVTISGTNHSFSCSSFLFFKKIVVVVVYVVV